MKQQQKSDHTRGIIIHTAFELFFKQGYRATTINEIMNATSLSKGAFYHHFSNKKDLGNQVISTILKKRIYEGLIDPLQKYKEQHTGILLSEVFINRLNSFTRRELLQGCPINNLINEIGHVELEQRLLLRALLEDWKLQLTKVITYGQAQGQLKKDIDPKACATFLIAAFEGIRGIRKVYDDNDLIEHYKTALQAYVINLKHTS